jgi:hypothetical protein
VEALAEDAVRRGRGLGRRRRRLGVDVEGFGGLALALADDAAARSIAPGVVDVADVPVGGHQARVHALATPGQEALVHEHVLPDPRLGLAGPKETRPGDRCVVLELEADRRPLVLGEQGVEGGLHRKIDKAGEETAHQRDDGGRAAAAGLVGRGHLEHRGHKEVLPLV